MRDIDPNHAFILTYLPEGIESVSDHLENPREVVYEGMAFREGDFNANGRSWLITIGAVGQHSNNAFTEVKLAIDTIDPQVVLLVDIAEGIKDVTLGDVVAANLICIPKSENLFDFHQASSLLGERAEALANSYDWLKRIKGSERSPAPRAFAGAVLAVQKVIRSVSSIGYNDAIAVIMEGQALAAVYASQKIHALGIFGISDLVENKKRDIMDMDRGVASQNATAFAFEILATLDLEKNFNSHPAEINNIPYDRNPNFLGREDCLVMLRNWPRSSQDTVLTKAIVGLGGVGKTQLVLEYVYRYIDDYATIWWVRSEEPTTIIEDFASLAAKLNLPETAIANSSIQAESAKHWLESNSNWLLIFDDAQEPSDLEPYIPKKGYGHILITSRYSIWKDSASTLNLNVLSEQESIEFLQKRTRLDDRRALLDLAAALGSIPLALELASAYIEKNGISVESYLQKLHDQRNVSLLLGLSNGYPQTVVNPLSMCIEAAKRDVPASIDLLAILSLLDLDRIPIFLFNKGSSYLIEPLASIVLDRQEFEKTISTLNKYSLINVSQGEITLHVLVRNMVRYQINKDELSTWSEVAANLMKLFFSISSDSVPNWDDNALRNIEDDKLGRDAFARYLSARISLIPNSSEAYEAYMIHLYAPWGAGKSTVMNFLGDELDSDGQWLVARYNAWQNQHVDPCWWSLMDSIFQSIKSKLGWEIRFREYLWRINATTPNLKLIILLIWFLALVVIPYFSQEQPDATNLTTINPIQNTTTFLAALAANSDKISKILAVIITLWGIIKGASQSLGSANTAETFARFTSDPMVKIKRHFEDFVKRLKPKNLIILIDDLDRCQSKRVVELLESIQTLFREASVVIVVAADHRWLNACYEQTYDKFSSKICEPGKPLGYLFLEKAFRFSTSIPGFPENLKRKFWCHLLQVKTETNIIDDKRITNKAREMVSRARSESELNDLAENGINRSFEEQRSIREEAVIRLAAPDVMERLEHTLLPYCEFLENNPRAMKRLVNTYSANRALAILSEVKIELHQLALWTILQSRYPLFAEYLEKHPGILEKIGQRNDNLPEIPEGLTAIFADTEVIKVIQGGSLKEPLQRKTIEQCAMLHG